MLAFSSCFCLLLIICYHRNCLFATMISKLGVYVLGGLCCPCCAGFFVLSSICVRVVFVVSLPLRNRNIPTSLHLYGSIFSLCYHKPQRTQAHTQYFIYTLSQTTIHEFFMKHKHMQSYSDGQIPYYQYLIEIHPFLNTNLNHVFSIFCIFSQIMQ